MYIRYINVYIHTYFMYKFLRMDIYRSSSSDQDGMYMNILIFTFVRINLCVSSCHVGMYMDIFIFECVHINICVCSSQNSPDIGWLRLVGSIKLQVSFAECCLFYGALLQKRPTILSILLTKVTPYLQW